MDPWVVVRHDVRGNWLLRASAKLAVISTDKNQDFQQDGTCINGGTE